MVALLLSSASINILLALKVKSEQRKVELVKAENRLQTGRAVPDITGKSPEGVSTEINFPDMKKPTILYVFTPTCIWCKRNFNNMMVLRHGVQNQYAFFGISLTQDGTREYVAQHAIDYPVISDIPEATKVIYRMGGTPATIVVSADRKVLQAWTGAYSGPLKKEIEQYFKIQLPGLIEKDVVASRK
jgi:peroxiredoxin